LTFLRGARAMLLNNRYQTIQKLGEGGFGQTFLAEDTQMPSRRRCVIKQLKPLVDNPQVYQIAQERFQREAAILEAVGNTHPLIPDLYAYFAEAGQFYLIQEWIEGQTLSEQVKTLGTFSETAVKDILIEILRVLDYVHSHKIIHRDIKPDNIILRQCDRKPVLIDFGAVKEVLGTVVNAQGHSTTSIVIGTPGFMSSEQAAGRPTFSSDLYSLGLTIIYLLTGRPPTSMESDPRTGEIAWHPYAWNLSPAFVAVLDKAIQPHARDRYATAQEMLTALQAAAMTPLPPTQPAPQHQYPAPVPQPTVPPFPTAPPPHPQPLPSQPTQLSSPQLDGQRSHLSPATVYPDRVSAPSGLRDWQKAAVMGSAIGICVVVGLVATRAWQSFTSPIAIQNPTPSVPVTPTATPITDSTPALTQATPAVPEPVDSPSVAISESTPTPSEPLDTPTPDIPTPVPQSTQSPDKSTETVAAPVSTPAFPSPAVSEPAGGGAIPEFSQADAKTLIGNWLQAKRVMFAPPYNRQPAAEFTTGRQYQDLVKPNGSIDWLEKNQARYEYSVQRIDGVEKFAAEGDRATIQVKVTEAETLYIRGKVDASKSGFDRLRVRYTLQRVDGQWKIADSQILK
jgi:serine/threonine-protein kinase